MALLFIFSALNHTEAGNLTGKQETQSGTGILAQSEKVDIRLASLKDIPYICLD
ncbi:MAG: hypothetical protein ACTTKN_03510 [Phocaeicola sp.]|uniref:hypothetical protein n=1 Tax=Phocaeicola sp. TaxID=2773926 RepID=UPI003F9F4FDE